MRRLLFWLPVAALALLTHRALMDGLSRLPPSMTTRNHDLRLYRAAGEAVLRGDLPYSDFFIEYPPASFLSFVLPAATTHNLQSYINVFAAQMSVLIVAALVLTALAARRMGLPWPLSALFFAAGAVLLYPVATTRYDALVTLVLAATALLVALGRRIPAWAALGLGAAAKLVPALAAIPLLGTGGWRQKAWGVAAFLAVAGVFLVPALITGSEGLRQSLRYQTERGVQLESLPASILLKLGNVHGVTYEYGAWDVNGEGVGLAEALSLPITVALLAITAAVSYRAARDSLSRADYPRFAATFLLAFMIGSKVLSPQYMLWLLPVVALSATGAWAVVVGFILLAACWATTQIFPFHYLALARLQPGAIDLLLARNLLLVILWALMLALPAIKEKRE